MIRARASPIRRSVRQSAPRTVNHSATSAVTTKPAMKIPRHHVGKPCRPNRRAVSAGTLCTATSCCSSCTAPRNPSTCEPNATSPIAATSASAAIALSSRLARSRRSGAHRRALARSSRNGSTRPADTLMPTPRRQACTVERAPRLPSRTLVAASARRRELPRLRRGGRRGTAVNASARQQQHHERVVVVAAHRELEEHWVEAHERRDEAGERPMLRAPAEQPYRARLASAESTLNAHSPPARPRGTKRSSRA